MIGALIVFWRGIRQFEGRAWVYVVGNIFCALLCLPIVTAPLAFAGLSYLSHAAITEPTAHPDYFWVGVRKHWRRGLLMGVANIVILAMVGVNLAVYARQTTTLYFALRIVWIVTLVGWLSVQMYLWPLLEEMEQPTLINGLRNAGLMVLANPIFSATLFGLLVLIFVLSAALIAPLGLITLSIIAAVVNTAVIDRLTIYRAKRAEEQP